MSKVTEAIKNFLDFSGLDLLPYAIGLLKFNSKPPFEPTKLNDIRENIQSLDSKKLEDALIYSKESLDEEFSRGEKVESKAHNLIGVAGISAAFITSISSLFPKEASLFSSPLSTLILVLYILIVVSLTLTIMLASRAVMVRGYTRPDVADIFKMKSISLKQAKLERLASNMYCYSRNSQTHNIKVSYLIGAQLWFRNSIVFFLLLAFILTYSVFKSTAGPTVSITNTSSSTLTVQFTKTAGISTATSQPTITKTLTPLPAIPSSTANTTASVTTQP